MARTSTRAPSPTRLEATAWPAGPGRGAGGRRQGQGKQQANAPSNISDLAPLVWRPPRGLRGMAAVPVGSGRTGRTTRRRIQPHTATRRHRCGGRRRDLPRCRWAAAGPGRASRRRAERSSRRGRLAGGPPPTGTQSSPAQQDSTPGAQNTSGATSNNSRRYKQHR